MRYTHLLFDADGTLYDFEAAESFAITSLFEALGIPNTQAMLDCYSAGNKSLWMEFEQGAVTLESLKIERFRRFFDAMHIQADPYDAGMRYLDYLGMSNHMYNWTVPILTRLRSEGYVLSLITNGIASVQRGRLAATNTTCLYDAIIISEEIGVQKPNPKFFDFIPESKRSACLIIGDSLSSDIAGGKSANIDTLWFNRNNRIATTILPTYEMSSLFDLPEFLAAIV